MVGRGEVTDQAWARIEPLLPAHGRRGGRWRDHRQVLNAILWKLRTGAPWRDLPERYGPWKTAHERLRRWTADGTWERILAEVIVKDDAVGEVEWVISVDSSSVRAHQHAAGARKKGAAPTPSTRSRSTGSPRPVTRRADQQAAPGRRRRRPAGGGHPDPRPGRRQPSTARPDRHAGRPDHQRPSGPRGTCAGRQGLLPPLHPPGAAPPQDQDHHPRTQRPIAVRQRKGPRGGRPYAFDRTLYRQRNVVERCFNRLKQFRDLATRYAKRAAYYRSEVLIACIILHLR